MPQSVGSRNVELTVVDLQPVPEASEGLPADVDAAHHAARVATAHRFRVDVKPPAKSLKQVRQPRKERQGSLSQLGQRQLLCPKLRFCGAPPEEPKGGQVQAVTRFQGPAHILEEQDFSRTVARCVLHAVLDLVVEQLDLLRVGLSKGRGPSQRRDDQRRDQKTGPASAKLKTSEGSESQSGLVNRVAQQAPITAKGTNGGSDMA